MVLPHAHLLAAHAHHPAVRRPIQQGGRVAHLHLLLRKGPQVQAARVHAAGWEGVVSIPKSSFYIISHDILFARYKL